MIVKRFKHRAAVIRGGFAQKEPETAHFGGDGAVLIRLQAEDGSPFAVGLWDGAIKAWTVRTDCKSSPISEF